MNKVMFIGRLAKDPELNYTTQNKKAVVNFPIAVDRRLVLGREKETETDFFNVVAWTTTGEFVMRNFTKGQPICVVGRLQQRSWVDEATQTTRYAVEIVAEDIHFAGFKRDEAQNGADFDPTAPYEDNVAA